MRRFIDWFQSLRIGPDRDFLDPERLRSIFADDFDDLPPSVGLRRRRHEPPKRSARRVSAAYNWVMGALEAQQQVRTLRRSQRPVTNELARRASRIAMTETAEPEEVPVLRPSANPESDQRRALRALAVRQVRRNNSADPGPAT
jgi:hypothetical protein